MAVELQTQQQELQKTNEELEEKARQLTSQKAEVERKNRDVEVAKQELEEKAEQLALTSRYKSQFLANMSHELRTPLNSLLILSRQLEENRDGNLTGKQTEYASTIHQSGADLLALINEILDLAKIESGTMTVDVSEVSFDDLKEFVDRSFRHVAEEKGLEFDIEVAANVPAAIKTDEMRLRQVLRNLLSNALKFTERGTVSLRVFRPARPDWSVDNEILNKAPAVIGFSVVDTGIGIPREKQKIVFEAFQQADGGTSRKYGGTGLGLAISREIAGLLGGELHLQSEPGVGSTLTLYVPAQYVARARAVNTTSQPILDRAALDEARAVASATLLPQGLSDDRHAIQPGDRVLLIVEDDESFGRILLGFARERGFKGVVAAGGAQGLELARSLNPDAITLDLRLPDMDGWVVLDRLKHDVNTRHIPVHVISALDDERRGLDCGAIAYLQKPAEKDALEQALERIQTFLERRLKHLLVVEDDEVQRKAIVELIGEEDVATTAVDSAEAALKAIESQPFDCVVLDLKLPGMSGFDLMRAIRDRPASRRMPVIVYTGKELDRAEEVELRRLAETIIVKDVRSPDRLLDETALFLHRVQSKLPPPKRDMLRKLTETDPTLVGRTVLLVDDDARNLFAITAILEQHDMKVVYAENGQQALDKLVENEQVEIVLMDIMMPEMDGYEATRRIRAQAKYARLPIVALTAKAMKGDREKCLSAGASDYITKPIDADQLVSLLRVWLYAAIPMTHAG
jgi:CheY-like chemotaxis protein/signal transduction histidine kinase